jgi:GNAT superfamily N-acetyltransferase
MEVRIHADLQEFWSHARPLFASDPVRHTVGISVIRQTLAGTAPDALPPVLVTIWNRDRIAGAGFRMPPWPMWTSAIPAEAIELTVPIVFEIDPELPGVTGTRDVTEPFADEWSKLTGVTVKEVLAKRLYRLAGLETPIVPGQARQATENDVALMAQWRVDFQIEAMGYERDPGSSEFNVRRSLAMGNGSFLWEVGGEVVSHAVAGAPADGMSRIGPVYTPPEHRGKGYGSAITAAVSQWALDAGAENVLLFTDLANPTSNSIYQRIGYRPVYDATELAFHK